MKKKVLAWVIFVRSTCACNANLFIYMYNIKVHGKNRVQILLFFIYTKIAQVRRKGV